MLRSLFFLSLLLLALAPLSYFFWDKPLILHLPKPPSPFFSLISFLIAPAFQLSLWTGVYLFARLRRSRHVDFFLEVAAAQGLAALFVRVVKMVAGRARPELFLNEGLFGFYGWHLESLYHSFPSGHTIAICTFVTSLSLLLDRKCLWLFPLVLLLALLLASSRILLLRHFPSDVLTAGGTALLIGYGTHQLRQREWIKRACARLKLTI